MSKDPYLQMYWYYEDLRDKYVNSDNDKKDGSRLKGTEKVFIDCIGNITVDGVRADLCKFCILVITFTRKNHLILICVSITRWCMQL